MFWETIIQTQHILKMSEYHLWTEKNEKHAVKKKIFFFCVYVGGILIHMMLLYFFFLIQNKHKWQRERKFCTS